MLRRATMLTLGVIGLAGQGSAQDTPGRRCHRPEDWVAGRPAADWARRFAPILRFADSETYYPTVPFFAAFDGEDNDGTGPGIDFADIEEISPLGSIPGRIDWAQVHRWYTRRGQSITPGAVSEVLHPADTTRRARREISERRRRLEAAAVGYRVCMLDEGEGKSVWRYLRSDEQAWRRFRNPELGSKELRDRTSFLVVEYYLYYVNDAGLQGHANDLEGVFVLQLLDQGVSGDEKWRDKPVIVIGPGHSPLTPNNVLTLIPGDVSTMVWVRDFQPGALGESRDTSVVADLHPNVLIELGGHSSAPDIEPYGTFTPGVDVNWHLDDVWGTRDVQAVAGTGFLGPFRYDMEFPRSGSAPFVVPPTVGCPAAPTNSVCAKYGLVAIHDLERLLEWAADTAQVSNDRFRSFVDTAFASVFPNFAGFRQDASEARVTAVRRALALWRTSFGRQGGTFPRGKFLPWHNAKATSLVSDQLKLYLFRPAAAGISSVGDVIRLLNYGVRYETGSRIEPYVGFIVPGIASNLIPVRFPGFLELQVGAYRRIRNGSHPYALALGALWEHRYVGNVPVSSYLRASWIPSRESALGDSTAANGSFAAGVSLLLPVKKHKSPLDLVNAIRLRTGLRMDLGHWGDAFRGAGWEFSISFRQ